MVSVRVEDVWCTIGKQTILRGIDLHINQPITVLLGVNGAGKTTLFRVLAGALPAARGAIRFERGDGKPPRSRRLSVGYLPQAPRPVRGVKARQYLEYFAYLKRMSSADARHEIDEVLALTGLSEHATKRTLTLSGGLMRRLALGAAVIGSPDLVLLDEPTAGLDPEQRVRMRELVKNVAERVPVVLSTHLAEDTAQLADHVVVLHDGRVVGNRVLDARAPDGEGRSTDSVEDFFLAAIRSER